MAAFTDAQTDAINAQGGSVLVSAAAGSGKTTVLIERIIRMITRRENPIDVDRLLIVTFTRAAASEMKERLAKAINSLLENDPYNSLLLRQRQLMYNTSICTIDSFCGSVVREYFHILGVQKDFRLADENEIKVIYKLIKNTELEIPFLLASQCGLRPSEICALTKDCITADGLEIRKAVVINEHGREVYKPPKSYAGYRTIPISPLLRDKLMNTPDKKRICVISSNKISRDWNSFLRKHGLHIFRFYSLRHYYASQALLLGIPQKYIAELMGHSSTDMIEKVYQHTFPSAMEEFKVRIADNIEKLLG